MASPEPELESFVALPEVSITLALGVVVRPRFLPRINIALPAERSSARSCWTFSVAVLAAPVASTVIVVGPGSQLGDVLGLGDGVEFQSPL
jgi:hypothetical protein